MRVRFGYVAMALDIQNGSPNRTITFQNLQKLPEDVRLLKLKQLAEENLKNQLRILKYNAAHDIDVFRMTSKLVPLVTHEVAQGWDYAAELKESFQGVGEYVRSHGFRVSFHPDHFVKLNSPKEDIFKSSVHILEHHYIQAKAMNLGEDMMFNIHVGGVYQNREVSLERFIQNWALVPQDIQRRITLENDDKTFTARETLICCQKLGVPMVFDIHHHRCNHEEDSNMAELFDCIVHTWGGTSLPPKIHMSSPRGLANGTELRSHADFVNSAELLEFLHIAKYYTNALDVMIEAKKKDQALKKLMKDLDGIEGVQIVNQATIEVI